MDKNQLINKIKEIQGLTNDEKSTLLELLNTQKKYGLVWEDKPEDIEEKLREELPVIKEVKERAIISDDKKAPNHILIEGDNLEALTSLCFTHEGKIDVIYIDPPYNTGNKDFIYNDRFVDKEDSYRHSKWLSFINRRLKIAKQLLSEKGIIFISIDDNEQAQLKLLCDEVFGGANFIAQFIHKNNSNKNQAKLVGISTEYLYCYVKNKDSYKDITWKVEKKGAKDIVRTFVKLKKAGLSLEEIEKEIKHMYKRPKYAHLSRWNKINEFGVFKDADLSREGGPIDYTIINPNTNKECSIPKRGWGKSHEELIRLQKENLIWYGDDSTPPGMIDYITSDDLCVPDSFLYYDNSVDTKWQKKNFGKLVFDNPKPLEMIKFIIGLSSKQELLILDFFAGSGTTLHATMELNAEDGGNRQCILITNNENNICEDVTYERNKRVIKGYTTSKGAEVEDLRNNNLRYYRTEFISRDQTMSNKRKLITASTDLLCVKENIYTESKFFGSLKLKPSIARYFEENEKKMLIIYNEETVSYFVREISEMNLNEPIKIYVFSPGQYAFDDDFFEVADKVILCALPAAIYAAYKKVLPKRKDVHLDAIAESKNETTNSMIFSEENMKGE